MPWNSKIPDLKNNPAYLEPRITVAESQLAEKATVSDVPSSIPRTLAKLERGENVYIVVAGDSITKSVRTDDENSYTAYLCRLLASKYSKSTIIRIDGNYSAENTPINTDNRVTVQTGVNGQTITVFKCGVGGDTVLRLFRRLNNVVQETPQGKPDLVTIMLGVNDSLSNDATKYATPQEFKAGMEALITRIRIETNAEIALLSTSYNDFGTSYTSTVDGYAEAIKSLAISEKTAFVDIHKLWMDHMVLNGPVYGQGNWLTGIDGDTTHPSYLGSEAIGKEIFRVLFQNDKISNIAKIASTSHIAFNDTSINYGSGWNYHEYYHDVSGYHFKEMITNQLNPATFTFSGDKIYLRTRKGDLGEMNVQIDGKIIPTINLYRANPVGKWDVNDTATTSYYGERVLLADGLGDGNHTISISKTTDDGKYICIVGFDIELFDVTKYLLNKTSETIETPVYPSLSNGWANIGGGNEMVNYYKYKNRVFLDGTIKDGTLSSVIFALPEGMRPLATIHLNAITQSGAGELVINTNGDVILSSGSNTWASLSGLSFRCS